MDQNLSEVSDEEILRYQQYIGKRVKHLREEKNIPQLQMALSLILNIYIKYVKYWVYL